MTAILEKMLLEDDFLTQVLANGQEIVLQYDDVLPEQANQIAATRENIISFFGNKDTFAEKLQSDLAFKEQVLEYSKEKFTYMLASEQSGQQQRIVWVLG